MRDVLLVASLAAFFLICVAYVSWCDRLVGADPTSVNASDPTPATPDPSPRPTDAAQVTG